MIKDFILPDIGEGIVECELVKWLVHEGDVITEDQPVAEVMTDKALVEIPAPHGGRVRRLYYKEGDTARVHEPLFAVEQDSAGESVASPGEQEKPAGADPPGAGAAVPATAAPAHVAAQGSERQVPEAVSGQSAASRHPIPASPAVRRMARELSLDLNEIPATGKNGRVLKEDVTRFRQRQSGQPAEPVGTRAPEDAVRIEPIRGVRAVMARRMAEAAATIPHFNYGDEIDVTALLALREELRPLAGKQGVRLTLMPFIMKAIALAVQAYPLLNSQVDADCTEIRYQPHCNIGMAVDTPAGLIVPNVKQVERLTILDIAREVARLAGDAREGRVQQDDLRGGTISISNIGALGGTYAAPIISKPEVAIVALGRTQKVPKFDDSGAVVARSIMPISWAGDHRIIDGGTMARFSNLWRDYLQQPASMLLNLC